MTCCDQNCRQGRDCEQAEQRSVYDMAIRALSALGMFAVVMFLLGYAYASVPLVLQKTCTPSIIDRILK